MGVLSACVNLLESSSVTCDPVFSPEAIFVETTLKHAELRANKQVLNLRETESSSWYQLLDRSGQVRSQRG